jgi:hypothetical protein
MKQKPAGNPDLGKSVKQMLPSLIVSWLIPWGLYTWLSGNLVDETTSLAVSAAIPAVWTVIRRIWSHRVDWIGFLGTTGFVAALTITLLAGGGALPLKLHHPAIIGTIGIVCLVSVMVRKPIFTLMLTSFHFSNPERFQDPAIHKKITLVTMITGIGFLIDAILQVAMALTLTTGLYLIASKIVTLSVLAAIFLIIKSTNAKTSRP